MAKITFATSWDTPVITGEKNSGELLVDTTGYIRPDVKIKSFIAAGQALKEYQATQCDYDDGVDRDNVSLPRYADKLEILGKAKKAQELAEQALARITEKQKIEAMHKPQKLSEAEERAKVGKQDIGKNPDMLTDKGLSE